MVSTRKRKDPADETNVIESPSKKKHKSAQEGDVQNDESCPIMQDQEATALEGGDEVICEADEAAKDYAIEEDTKPDVRDVKPDVKKEDDLSDDEKPLIMPFQRKTNIASKSCPYLNTVNRAVLDFDFEKLCSVSLSHTNIYACLVCGKYFQGRGSNTYAYTHSLETNHRVFLNLMSLKFYCLPDDYEIIDSSLADIKHVTRPTYSKQAVRSIGLETRAFRAQDDATYRPGLMGLNNIKANDYCNVILHAFSNTPPIRDYFLREENYAGVKRPPGDKLTVLVHRFGELIRKLWNPRAFKTHVSPHEMLQAVVLCSEKRFQITKQSNCIDFMQWLLVALHQGLNGTKKTSSSIIYKTFRGKMRVFTRKLLPVDAKESDKIRLLNTPEYKEREEEQPFMYLTVDLPDAPVHRDELLANIIPQVPLGTILKKFDGTTEKEYNTYNENFIKRFTLTKLPPYMIVYYKRFTKNKFYVEKNPTIVNFAIKNVDFHDMLDETSRYLNPYTTYDLVANIVHDGKPESGSYRIQMINHASQKWYELEDLHVKEILPQIITLTESYIQIWQLNRTKTRDERKDEKMETDDMSQVTN